PLPVKLLNFTGSYRNNVTTLNWETVNEQLFDRFEVERSSNGADFTTIGIKPAAASNYSAKQGYQLNDDLSSVNGSVFYYRLKMIDTDGKFKHSSVIMIRKEGKTLNGIAVNPSPVINGIATVRFSSTAKATVDFRVVDMQGRVVLQQQNKVYEGNNSVSLNNLSRLQPGVYTLQMVNGAETEVVKFAVAK
ncbi:MAG TPA: T9SS type A sorting domain-containing protein, partial [Chitinophagaceae bacterium]|nr:T9SS type A sorting domain-containing protein [Chitinophagaceae bacterium]